MSAKQLVAIYDSWEELTRQEGAAIQRNDWQRVSECQTAKKELQRRIIHLTDAARTEVDSGGFEQELRPIINRLIAMENSNVELLAEQRRTAELHKAELDQSSRNLRRMHKSYAQPQQSVWHSYS